MKGNVFQCHRESTNKQQLLKSVRVLDEHINKTFAYPQDITSICRTFEVVKPTQPPNLTKEDDDGDMDKRMIWQTYIKSYMKRTDMIKSNIREIYAILWGQCSPMMQSKLASLDDYDKKSNECGCIWLLKEIQGITHRFEGMINLSYLWMTPSATTMPISKAGTSPAQVFEGLPVPCISVGTLWRSHWI
jgi:hypothetical protein